MNTPYDVLKASIDPVVFLLAMIAIGFLVSVKKKRKKLSENTLLLAAFLFLYTASLSPVSNALCYFLEKDYLLQGQIGVEHLDIVVVLGGGVSDNKYVGETLPSYQTASRLLYSAQVFRKSEAKYLVYAGKGRGRLSEAEVMRRAAIQLGISDERIKIDSKSRNTWEHAVELNKMFYDKDIKIGLVTSAYHMKRSEKEFKKYFSNIIPLPSDYLYSSMPITISSFFPRTGGLHRFSIAIHEITGIAWYKLRR